MSKFAFNTPEEPEDREPTDLHHAHDLSSRNKKVTLAKTVAGTEFQRRPHGVGVYSVISGRKK